MRSIRRISTAILSSLLALSVSVTSLAADPVNGTGGGEISTGSTPEIVGSFWKVHFNQGWRLSLINESGVLCSTICDVVQYFPEDVKSIYGQSNEDVKMLWEDYFNNSGLYRGTPKSKITYLGGNKTDIIYSAATCNLDGSDGKNGIRGTYRKDGDYTKSGSNIPNVDFADGRMYTYSMIEQLLVRDAEKQGYELPITGKDGKHEYIAPSGEKRVIDTKFLSPLQEGVTSTGALSLYGTGEIFKNQLMAPITYTDGAKYNIIQRILEMDVFDADGRGNLKSTNLVKMFEYVDPVLKQQYEDLVAAGAKNPMTDVFRNNNLRMLIEPIHWSYVYMISPTDPRGRTGAFFNAAYCTPTMIYGTTTEAFNYSASLFWDYCRENNLYDDIPLDYSEFCSWITKRGIGIDWDWDLGDECYMLAKDDPEIGLYKYDPATQGSLENFLRYYNSLGYGVMVTRLAEDEEQGSSTSTWDKINCLHEEGAAPENTNPDGSFPKEYPSEGENYEKAGKDHAGNIVKFYGEKKEDNTVEYFQNFEREQTVHDILVENENEYTVDGWFTSNEYKKPESENDSFIDWKNTLENKQQGNSSGRVVMQADSDENTLYVSLVKKNTDLGSKTAGLVLHENEISKNFSLSDVTGNLVSSIREYSSVEPPTCWAVIGTGDDGEDETCGSTMSEDDPGEYSFSIHNRPSYNKEFVYMWTESNTDYSGAGQGAGGFNIEGTPDMDMTLSRNIKDKATLYPGLNTDKAVLNDMGLVNEGYTPAGQRHDGKAEQENRATWTDNFNTNWQYEDVNDPDVSFSHHDSDSKHQESTGDTSGLNSQYSQPGNTTIYGLWGKHNNGLAAPSDNVTNNKWELGGLKFTSRKAHVDTSKQIKFYPYYRMIFETLETGQADVYLTAENLSALLSVQRVDTSMLKTGAARGLDLSSYQWQTHTKVMNGLNKYGVDDKDSVLPAGGIYTLRTGNSSDKASDTWVGMRIFSTYVADKNKLADATGIMNQAEASESVGTFKEQVKKVLEGYEIVMNGAYGVYTGDEDKFYDESIQVTGRAGKYKLGQELAKDEKYDLQTKGTGANRSDIDILDIKDEQYDWKLESTVDGEVKVYRDGKLLETIEKGSQNISNSEVADFNSRTNLVSNYILALDRNLGADRQGESWYNEAWSEVHCIENRVAYKLGFGGGQDGRSAALNIKLAGLLDNRSDLYNFDESTIEKKARTFKFYTSAKSTVDEAGQHGNGWIGTFAGQDIVVPGIHMLLQSKFFYTSNGTVTDLN